MGDLAIRAEKLSKHFRLGEAHGYRTLRESLARWASPSSQTKSAEGIWALRDVSFEVERGAALGIVGRNGAGKSTLLKILARITPPTGGYARLHGRVGSLLEVGTGFHPELTGRENVFLNGAILGMRKSEITTHFDTITEFAGVERFLDTPVKRYSSGMRMRLAFAVAAHLEPEILIIDEVLAVGDAAFQRQCLGKMNDVARSGRTVLFVSHNLKAVRRLCPRSIWIEDGRVAAEGPTDEVVDAYLDGTQRGRALVDVPAAIAALDPDPAFRLEHVELRQRGLPCDALRNGEPAEVEIRYEVIEAVRGLRVYFDLCDGDGEILIRSFHDDDADAVSVTEPGRYTSIARIPENLLAPRDYRLVVRGSLYDQRALTGPGISIGLSVEATSGLNRAYPGDPIRSKLQPALPWETKRSRGE